MESQSNDSSSDSDTSPTSKQIQSNQSESGSQDETASGTLSPIKSMPERVSLNITRMSKTDLFRTTSLSSQNSDSLYPNLLPGKRAPARGGERNSSESEEVRSDLKRVTRSSCRGKVSSKEPKVDPVKRKIKTEKSKKFTRKTTRKLRNKNPIKNSEKESEYSSEAEDTDLSSPPLVLLVSIPIENSSINGEDNSSLSDELSEISGPAIHNKGKDIRNLEEDYDSRLSAGNSCEDSNSVISSREDSAREEEILELVGGEKILQTWEHQPSSSDSEGDSQSESEVESQRTTRSHKLTSSEKIIENYTTDKSGKSIPSKKKKANKNDRLKSRFQQSVGTPNKRKSYRNKLEINKEEKNRKKVKHIIQLDKQLDKDQLETVLLESYNILRNRDLQAIFFTPVTDDMAPGYSKLITQPMDFSHMKDKIQRGEYIKLEELYNDFLLMCQNAMSYNKPTTFYYRTAKRIKETGVKSLEKMARARLVSQEKIHSVSSHTSRHNSDINNDNRDSSPHTNDITDPLMVRIDRSILSAFPGEKMTLSPTSITPLKNVSSQENDIKTDSQPMDEDNSSSNNLNAKLKLLKTLEVTSHELITSKAQKDVVINPDTALLPPPSSFSLSLSPKNQTTTRPQTSTTDSTAQYAKLATGDLNTHNQNPASSKKQLTPSEIKQRKYKKRQEQIHQRFYTRATQARRIYRGSLAPVRPLSYGSFASFAPSYDSSFANINGQETDRVCSLLDHRELKECDNSMLYMNYNEDVSPFYLRLADGILNLDKDINTYDKNLFRRTDRDTSMPPDIIRMHMLRQQAFQGEIRRRMELPPDVRVQQQLDDMLQQSAELISSLSQKQGREENQDESEELDKINKILMTIGTTLKTNDL